MIDIATELAIIASNQYGENVRAAINTALGKLNEVYEADIAEEQVTLGTTTKGNEMKESIIDALSKLYASTPSGGGGALPAATSFISSMVVTGTKIEHAIDVPQRVKATTSGVWGLGSVGSVSELYYITASPRLTVGVPYAVPKDKTVGVVCLTENAQVSMGLIDPKTYTVLSITGWQDFPRTIENVHNQDVLCVLNFRMRDDSAITPSSLGTVVAQTY